MEDLIIRAAIEDANLKALPVMDISLRGAVVLTEDGVFEGLGLDEASKRLAHAPHLLVNRVLAARRLGLSAVAAYDLLELFCL